MKKIIITFLACVCFNLSVYASDDFEKSISNNKSSYKYNNTTPYNFDNLKNKVEIPIQIDERISTKSDVYEGQTLIFHIARDVKLENVTYKKGSKVSGKIELITTNQAFGVPADITVSNFKIQDNDIKLNGAIQSIGANRSLWVYPLGYGIGIGTLGLGLSILAIRGGHAKMKPTTTYNVRYIPNL
jgi:hypothetical protein